FLGCLWIRGIVNQQEHTPTRVFDQGRRQQRLKDDGLFLPVRRNENQERIPISPSIACVDIASWLARMRRLPDAVPVIGKQIDEARRQHPVEQSIQSGHLEEAPNVRFGDRGARYIKQVNGDTTSADSRQ